MRNMSPGIWHTEKQRTFHASFGVVVYVFGDGDGVGVVVFMEKTVVVQTCQDVFRSQAH